MPLSIPLRTSTRHSQHLLGTLLLLCLTLVSGCFPFDDHKPDRQPPRLELADYPATTQERVVTLVGRAWDDEMPGRQVSRLHLQGEDLDEEVVLDGKQFQVRVALKPGVNHFTLTAEDGARHHTTRSVTIRRIALPTLTLLNPPSGSEVTTDQITVRGTVGSDWSPEKLSLDVQNSASRSADPIALRSGELSSYSFELTLPVVGAGLHSWVFTVHSPDGDVTTTWHVLRRADVPAETGNLEWTLDATPPAVTASAKWTFSGRVFDEQGSSEGISLQLLGSASAQAVQIAVDQQGHFQQPVDLAAGDNGFTLVASKSGYASRSVQYAIRRYALPELKILSPENGAQTSDESITVNGEIRTAWPLARLGLLANGQPITLLPLADQVYRFSLPFGLPELGLNTLRLQLASPDGEVTHVLQLYRSDKQEPVTALRLSLDSPQDVATEAASIELAGRVVDAQGNSDGITLQLLSAQRSEVVNLTPQAGGAFRQTVALSPGSNGFTLLATKPGYGSASLSWAITRHSPPKWLSLQPASGTHTRLAELSIEGRIATAWRAPQLQLLFQGQPQTLRVAGEDLIFQIPLVALQAGENRMQFSLVSPEGVQNLDYLLVRDADEPTETGNLEWTLDATPPAVTASAKWTFSGRVFDEQGSSEGISLQLLGSASAEAVQIAVDQQGHFQQPVDLAAGENGFTLVASKSGYASRSVQYAIRRYALPELKILSPENGAQTSDESITVNGEIRTAWPLARLGLLANGQPITLLPLADQVYRFSLPFGLPELGLNTLRLQLASPDGEVTHVLQLYRSDKQEPVTALRLSLDSPQDVATEAASIELAGRVVDAQGNSDGITLQLLSAQRSEVVNLTPQAGGAFRQTVALSPGSNGFTLLATKPGYGSARLLLAITRHSPPKWLSLQPASGTHTRLAELSIEGRIATAWRAPQLQLLFQGQPQTLRVAGEDLIFQIPLVALQAGENRMQFSLVSPEGVQNLDYLLVRDADEPTVDKIPPLLTIHTVANQLTGEDHLLISGLVQDPPPDASGVKKVLLSNEAFAGIVLAATIRGDQFQADMPLNSGPNHIRIQAFDEADNRASADILVTRAKAPRFIELVPASGTVLTTSETGLTGVIECDAGDTLERLSINESGLSFVKVGENLYRFSADAVTLQPGSNLIGLRADTRLSRGEASHDLIYRPADDDLLPKPTLTLLTPADQSMVQGDSVHLKVQVTSGAGKPKVTVDGQRYTLPMTGRSSSDGIYSALIDTQVAFAEGEDQLDVKIEAVDVLDKQAQLALRFYRDNRAPVITLGGYAPAPAINPVASNPVQLIGTVNDDNLANLLLNEQPVTLTPSGQGDDYQFVARFNLQPGETLPVNLVARDLGGNKTRQSYLFQSQASVVLEPVLPLDDATLMTNGHPLTVQVVASIANLPAGALVQVQLAGGETTILPHAGTLASGDITLPARTGAQELTYQVVANQVVLASAKRQVNIIDQASIPLTMLKSEPLNNQTNLEPDVPIVLYFNKSLDLTKLKFELRETLHGQTYVNRDSSGADFLQAKGYVLESVDRDQELVPVSASLLPDGQTVAFYLQRPLGFGAEAYVDVSYAGKEILRSRYQVRPLPTFIFGSIFDQFNQPLAGVEVSLPELGRTTQTNTEGAFSFGFQEAAGQEIPSGRYRLLINSTLSYSGFGSRRQLVSVVGATRNDLAVIRLSQLNPESPFMAVSSGQQKASFAGGELELDLSSARLLFPDSRDQGRLQVQFYPFEQLDSSTMPGVVPLWAYGSQPRGVAVEGTVGIRMRMPALNGGYDYLPEGTERVVLVAFDPQREVLTPIGIGRIENHMVISEGKLPLQSLDYLGYVVPDPSLQPQLSAVASGQQSLVTLVAQMAVGSPQ